jgi:hypothetical protein
VIEYCRAILCPKYSRRWTAWYKNQTYVFHGPRPERSRSLGHACDRKILNLSVFSG